MTGTISFEWAGMVLSTEEEFALLVRQMAELRREGHMTRAQHGRGARAHGGADNIMTFRRLRGVRVKALEHCGDLGWQKRNFRL